MLRNNSGRDRAIAMAKMDGSQATTRMNDIKHQDEP